MFYTLFTLCITLVNVQHTTSDYLPSQLISDGQDAQGRMAIDSKNNSYAINKNNKRYADHKGIINFLSSAMSIKYGPY